MGRLRHSQKVTSVIVAYELYRGISPDRSNGRTQRLYLDKLLKEFTVKAVTNSHAMHAAKLFRYSKGFGDPLIGAQCIEGSFVLVTTNDQDFDRMPNIRLATL